MKLDPRHLEILAAIVDHGGLTEGADHLGKSQPSLSRTMSQLEARIGAPLFHPGRRPLQPTELGRALAEQGRRVLAADRAASDIVLRYRSGQAGLVRVGGTPIFMDGVVASMLAEFQQHCPDVRVDQCYGYSGDLCARLSNGTLDLAITPLRPGAVPDGLTFQPILPGLNVIACRSSHPLARRSIVTLADIAPYPWIMPPVESPLYADLENALARIGQHDVKISFSGGTLASVVSVLSGSDALTVLPYSVVFMLRAQKQVRALSVGLQHPDRSLGLLTRNRAAPDPAMQRLRGFVKGRFKALSQRILQHQKDVLWRGAD